MLVAIGVVLGPALAHGAYLGPYDLLSKYGLTQQPGVDIHSPFAGDLITEMIPWTNLAWTQVHHGQLPLWNPYNALGSPLAFNWQSGVFSLPAIIGYLVPLSLAYTTRIIVTIVVAGVGSYILGRVLKLSALPSAFVGVTFAVSGVFLGWLGWPVASVLALSPWVFAAAVLVVRGGHRIGAIALLSVTLALSIYAGQPDTLIELGCFLLVFVVVLAVERWVVAGARAMLRGVSDLLIGVLGGIGLGAPLFLPGLQLIGDRVGTEREVHWDRKPRYPSTGLDERFSRDSMAGPPTSVTTSSV